MSLTPEQKIARLTERINRTRKEMRRLERQKEQTKRAERNHRLIPCLLASIETEARRHGMSDFEIDEEKATEIARVYFDKLDRMERTRARREARAREGR